MKYPKRYQKELIDAFDSLESRWLSENAGAKPLIGCLCLRVPPELIEGMGGIAKRIASEPAAQDRHSNLIRTDGCSFCRSVPDILKLDQYRNLKAVIAGACCDQMRRTMDTLQKYSGIPAFFYGAPRTWESDKKYFKGEMVRTFERMGKAVGMELDEVSLRKSIADRRKLTSLINRLREENLLPSALLHKISASPLPANIIVNFLNDNTCHPPVGGVNVMLMGSIPSGTELQVIEEAGGIVAADATCMGDRAFRPYPEDNGDPVEMLYDHYIEQNLCPHRRPYTRLIDYVRDLAERRSVEGVVYRSVKYCHPFGLSAKRFKQELNLPMLIIDDDLSIQAIGGLRTRIGAFIEMLEAKKAAK